MNSPILLMDYSGEIGFLCTLAIGAGIGAIASGITQIIENVDSGVEWYNNLGRSIIGGAVGGAVATIPIPGIKTVYSVMIMGGVGKVYADGLSGRIETKQDFMKSFAIGSACGLVGELASKTLSCFSQVGFAALPKVCQKNLLNKYGNINHRDWKLIQFCLNNGISVEYLNNLIEHSALSAVIDNVASSYAEVKIENEFEQKTILSSIKTVLDGTRLILAY